MNAALDLVGAGPAPCALVLDTELVPPEEAARLVIERLHELKVIPVEVAA